MTVAPSISELDIRALWHPLTQHKPLADSPPPLMVRGEGCYLEDDQGQRYLDAMAGLWCVNVGYGRRELAETAAAQMMELAYLAPTMTHAPGAQLADKILELLGWRGRVYFSSSGSEANEVAFKVARQYHQQSGKPGDATRYKIISRHRAYHGNTLGAMSATGQAERKIGYGPMAPGFIHVPPPYPYRGHPKLSSAEHGIACAQAFEETIIYEGPETVAALLMEPIISGGGVLVPPDEYLPRVREICDEYGVLLIFDEVVSGFGRTGKLFGHDHWQVKPDIITMAKGLSSGYMPLAATAVQEYIFDAFQGEAGDLRHFRHINTFGGHPVSTAVGLRNLQIVEERRPGGERPAGGGVRVGATGKPVNAPVGGRGARPRAAPGRRTGGGQGDQTAFGRRRNAGDPGPLQTGRRHSWTQRQHCSGPVQHFDRSSAAGGD